MRTDDTQYHWPKFRPMRNAWLTQASDIYMTSHITYHYGMVWFMDYERAASLA